MQYRLSQIRTYLTKIVAKSHILLLRFQKFVFTQFETMYTILLKPKQLNDENHRREIVCNIILLFSFLLLIVLDVLMLINYIAAGDKYTGVSPHLMFLITCSVICLLYYSRIGYSKYVSHGIIWVLIISGSYAQIMWGADLPSVILLWSFIITSSSILISTRYSFFLSICIGIGTITLQYLASKNILTPLQTWKMHNFKIDDAIEYASIFILIAGISWVSNREIYISLYKAKTAKDELQKERDLLEVKVAERTEQLHNAQIEKINNMYQMIEFGRISSGLFHDLVTPLNTLNLSISQISEIYKNDETKEINNENLAAIDIENLKNQINQCVKVSRKLMDFIDIAKRQINHTREEKRFDVCKEIEDTLCILKSKARLNNVDIHFFSKKNINTFGSPTLFSHIMTNLVSNAIDSYRTVIPGGINSTHSNRKVTVYCTKKQGYLEVKVKDFGSGIPINIQPKIFDTFFTTKNKDGCGIGLSATKHTTEKYFQGTISFESKMQHGTTFIVKIPIIK